jgi:hypothetical protein
VPSSSSTASSSTSTPSLPSSTPTPLQYTSEQLNSVSLALSDIAPYVPAGVNRSGDPTPPLELSEFQLCYRATPFSAPSPPGAKASFDQGYFGTGGTFGGGSMVEQMPGGGAESLMAALPAMVQICGASRRPPPPGVDEGIAIALPESSGSGGQWGNEYIIFRVKDVVVEVALNLVASNFHTRPDADRVADALATVCATKLHKLVG